MPPISVMIKPASGLCNMNCVYCFYHDEISKRDQQSKSFMTFETLRNVIRRTMLRADGMVSYAYQGGEPLLRGIDFFHQAMEYQQQYNGKRLAVSNALQTNGLLIDEKWCEFFRTNNFLIGISVDGIKQTHDTWRRDTRGQGTYDRIIENIKLLDKFGVEYNILTVVNQQTAASIELIYDDYKQRGWHYQQYILCMESLGEGHGKKRFAISPDDYGDFLIKLFDLWYRDFLEGKQPYIRQFENYIMMMLGYRAEACDQGGTCSIQYVVEADGNVYPCDFYALDEWLLGNFNSDQLDVIDRSREQLGFVERSQKLDPQCLSCEYFSLCRGGCQRYRELLPVPAGEEEIYYNYYCTAYKSFFAARIDKLKIVAASLLNKETSSC